jgi:adenylate cyclase
VSAKDVIEGRLPPDKVAGKLVLVGTSAVGLLDIKTTPLDPAMPGVEIHAQILETVLSRAVLSHPNWAVAAELVIVLVAGVTLSLLAPALGAGALLVLTTVTALTVTGLSWYLFTSKGMLLDLSFPLIAIFLITSRSNSSAICASRRTRRRIRSAFGQYLSPALVEQLAQSPEKLVLGGEARTMTIMFSDVRGFTTISETYKDDPQGLTQLMNRFLTPLTNAIIARKGRSTNTWAMRSWRSGTRRSTTRNTRSMHAAPRSTCCGGWMTSMPSARSRRARTGRLSSRSASASASIPAAASSAIWARTCVSIIRCWATRSISPRGSKAAPRPTARRSSSGGNAGKAAGQFATLELDLITVKGKTDRSGFLRSWAAKRSRPAPIFASSTSSTPRC